MIRIFIVKDNDKYICLNVDNDTDAQNLLDNGAKEIPQEQVKEIFGDHANIVSPSNTTVSEDGELISFDYTPPALEELKQEKLQELKSKANEFEQNVCKDMVIQSSLGYPMDADRRSQANIQGQITIMTDYNLDTIEYRCADDVIRKLSVSQLKTVYNEALINGQNLYTQKWKMETDINNATSKDELNAIDIKFTMMDFTS